jgi:hypothetical protein
MPKANFVTGWDNIAGRPDIPPMVDSEGGLQLHYVNGGVLRGGFACISYVPIATTCIVQIHSSQATIDAMKASEDYIWIEDIEEKE